LAWIKLKEKFQGKMVSVELSLRKDFYTARLLNIEDDPDVWVSSLEKFALA